MIGSKNPDNGFFSKTHDFTAVYLTRQAGKSYHTAKAYRACLSHLFDYVTKERGIHPFKFKYNDCTYKFVLEFSQYMQEKLNWSRATVNQHLSAIKKYLEYVSNDNIDVVQAWFSIQKVHSLKVTKRVKPIIESDDREAFFDAPSNNKLGNRDRTILMVLYDTAVRVSELVGINIGDIIYEKGKPVDVLIRGKGRKERTVGLSDDVADLLEEYMKIFHSQSSDPKLPLFYTTIENQMKRMSVRNVQRIVTKYCKIVQQTNPNVPKAHPHMLRRSRATELYRDGVPLELISVFLGHANVDTTTIYATPSSEQLHEATNRSYSDVMQDQVPIWESDLEKLKKFYDLA